MRFFVLLSLAVASLVAATPQGGPMPAVKPVGIMRSPQNGGSAGQHPDPTHHQTVEYIDIDKRAFQNLHNKKGKSHAMGVLELIAAALYGDVPAYHQKAIIDELNIMLDTDDSEDSGRSVASPVTRLSMSTAASSVMPTGTPTYDDDCSTATITPRAERKMSLPERLRRAGSKRSRQKAKPRDVIQKSDDSL